MRWHGRLAAAIVVGAGNSPGGLAGPISPLRRVRVSPLPLVSPLTERREDHRIAPPALSPLTNGVVVIQVNTPRWQRGDSGSLPGDSTFGLRAGRR